MEKVIQVENLYKSFGNKNVLNGISLSLSKGENLVIMGKSGTGKSVLTKCIIGLIEPDRGYIEVFGKSIFSLPLRELNEIRRDMGYVFQGGAIYDSMSVKDNLHFVIARNPSVREGVNIEEKIFNTLKSVGLEDSMNKMPSELSGGMRKRLGLARTLVLNPKVILYDEPTTGLDPVTSGEISDLILHVQEAYNTSSIIITHDIKCAKITSNEILMLSDGTIYARGKFNELAKNEDSAIKSYFN